MTEKETIISIKIQIKTIMNNFKRILVALVIAVTGIGAANAEFRFGIKAGVNVNDLSTNLKQSFDKNNRAGWTAGVMTEFQVPVIGIGFDVSLMYARLNSDPEIAGTTTDIENKNFIQLPINLKYKLSIPMVDKIIAPYIFTGPDFSFKLDKNTWEDVKTRTCQVAWNLGLGVQLFKHLQVGASYGFGLNNIVSKVTDKINIPEDWNIKNNYWTVTAAYLF